jgi:hypothetical protein
MVTPAEYSEEAAFGSVVTFVVLAAALVTAGFLGEVDAFAIIGGTRRLRKKDESTE